MGTLRRFQDGQSMERLVGLGFSLNYDASWVVVRAVLFGYWSGSGLSRVRWDRDYGIVVDGLLSHAGNTYTLTSILALGRDCSSAFGL